MCVSQSSGTCGSRSPCQAAPSARPNLGPPPPPAPRPSPHLAGCLSVRRVRGPARHAAVLSVSRSLARSLAPSLALPLRSGSAEGGGVGCRGGGGRGGSCILAVGEESEPALLVSRRAQLQPRGPARPLAARPGLLEWARARPRAGGGAGHCPYPRPPLRRGAPWGRGVRNAPPGVRGVPGSGSPPGGQSRTHGRPTRAPLQPILLVISASAARGRGGPC